MGFYGIKACYQCENREVGCHDKCAKYQDEKAMRLEEKREANKKRFLYNQLDNYEKDRSRKMRRELGRK